MKPINRQEVVLSSYDGTIALVRVQEVEDRGVLKKNESGRALAVRGTELARQSEIAVIWSR